MEHHHHYYDENDDYLVVEHAHPWQAISHDTTEIPVGCQIYWDHEGWDCSNVTGADSG